MTAKQRLMAVNNKLKLYLSNINTSLVSKGALAVSDIGDVSSAIDTISTGVTPTGTLSITQNGTYDVMDYASASVDVPDTLAITLLEGGASHLYNADITSLRVSALQFYNFGSSGGFTVDFPNLETINSQAFRNSKIKGLVCFPKLVSISNEVFLSATEISGFDFSNCQDSLKNNLFNGATSLKTVVVRKRNTLQSTGVFTSTPFRNGRGGTVYCDIADLSWYPTATNWSALESTTFASIQENLVTLQSLGVDITDYYEKVTILPTSDIDTSTVYFIETATAGTFEQWYNPTGSAWVQLANITLGA